MGRRNVGRSRREFDWGTEFTREQVEECAAKLKNIKAAGADGIVKIV